MPDFLPFPGVRYVRDDLGAVTAPPYDVIDDDERAALAARHERNAVHLILPEGPTGYDAAATRLRDWEAAGHLAADRAPRLYGYRMDFVDGSGRARSTTGVLGALRLPVAADAGDVLPHERTFPKAKSDRLALLRATRANLDPIWGLSLTAGLTRLVGDGPLLGRCTDEGGVAHRVFAIDDRLDEIGDAVAASPIVLADGHHRFETALAYRDAQRAAGLATPGDESILCLVVELADEQLWVQPIHRLLSDLPAGFDLRAALSRVATVSDEGPNTRDGLAALRARMDRTEGLGLVDARGLALVVHGERQDEPEDERQEVDAERFETLVAPVLPAGVDVTYRDDDVSVAALVDKGAVSAAALLRPVTVARIGAAAAARERMPQKTTFFAPKPRTGMVFRSLDLV